MNISKKWQAAAAGAIAIALVGGGASAANAAPGDPINPQPSTADNPASKAPGSKGGFFLFDGNTGDPKDSDGTRVYAMDEPIIGAASATDLMSDINPAPSRPVSGATSFTGVYAFLAEKNETDLMGGINTWNAYHVDAASGPNQGTLQPNLTLESFISGPGGIADDVAAGGSYWYGIAYTNLNGVQVAGAVYREINIATDGSGTYTVTPSILEEGGVPALTTQPASVSVEEGADATFTAAASGTPAPTVQWEASTNGTDWAAVDGATSDTLTVANVTLAQTATQYRAVYTNSEGTATSNAATLTVTLPAVVQPQPGDPNKLVAEDIVLEEGDTSVDLTNTGLSAGEYAAWAWPTATQLPNATVASNGDVTIDVSGRQPGTHTVALVEIGTNEVVGWVTVVVPQPSNTTVLQANVTTTNKFALEGINTLVDFGDVARGASVSKELTPFTVTDDRNTLPGWDLTAAVDDFVNDGVAFPANAGDVVGKEALEIEPVYTGGIAGIAASAAHQGAASSLFAEGQSNSTTGAVGTQFDANLTFAAPMTAKAGVYKSKLTLTLTSK